MPRPMVPAPITAMVSTCATCLARLFQFFQCVVERAAGGAQILRQTLPLFGVHAGNVNAKAAQGGGNVVYVIHGTDEFTSYWHKGSCHVAETSILDVLMNLVKLSQCKIKPLTTKDTKVHEGKTVAQSFVYPRDVGGFAFSRVAFGNAARSGQLGRIMNVSSILCQNSADQLF